MDIKVKYFVRLFRKSNGEFIKEVPVKNEYRAERMMAFYNEVTTNIRARVKVVEVKK